MLHCTRHSSGSSLNRTGCTSRADNTRVDSNHLAHGVMDSFCGRGLIFAVVFVGFLPNPVSSFSRCIYSSAADCSCSCHACSKGEKKDRQPLSAMRTKGLVNYLIRFLGRKSTDPPTKEDEAINNE